jgi:nitrite reductase/ring-hydroxylating ferredoxin subunit
MDGRIRCPWHGACFNVATGDIEDFPGMDGIQTYAVDIKGSSAFFVKK